MGIVIPNKPVLIFLVPGIFEQVILSKYDDSWFIAKWIPEQYQSEIYDYFNRCLTYGGSESFKMLIVGEQNYTDYNLNLIGEEFFTVGVIPLFSLDLEWFEEFSNHYKCQVETFSAGYTKD